MWHQFASSGPPDPAFVAISVHTDETGGNLDPDTLDKVVKGDHSIGLLTQVAPPDVRALAEDPKHLRSVPLTILAFEEAYG